MSIASEIERLRAARNDMRTKLVEMGLAAGTSDLDELADAVGKITNQGKVELKLDTETASRPIPAGYHNGGGRMYITVDEKDPVTPTKSTQTVSAGEGTVLGEVVVLPIPDEYQDVSDVTATTDDVLANKVFVDSTGAVVTGRMTNNGKTEILVDTKNPSVTITKGYHNGTGRAYVVVEDEKSITPTKTGQSVTAADGKILGKVTVEKIPDEYQDVSGVTAAAANVLSGKKFVDAEGTLLDGAMANNGSMNKSIDGLTATGVTVPKGYTDGGTVSLSGDIEAALAAI